MFDLFYVHCISATAGEPDRAPFTQYENRTVRAELYRISPEWRLGETEDSFAVKSDGEIIGYGDTKADAIGDARYRLMDRSRTAAYLIAQSEITV